MKDNIPKTIFNILEGYYCFYRDCYPGSEHEYIYLENEIYLIRSKISLRTVLIRAKSPKEAVENLKDMLACKE